MGTAGLWAYPWDIVADGIEASLGRMEACHIDEVSLATVYHSGQILSLAGQGPHFVSDPVQPLVDLRDPAGQAFLQQFYGPLKDRGLDLRGWTILFHDKPDWKPVETILGQTLSHAPCPAANQARARDLVLSVAESGWFDALDLESCGYTSAFHGAHHEISGVVMTPLLQMLLSICFCAECQSGMSDVHWDALRRDVRTGVGDLVNAASPPADAHAQLAGFLVENPVVWDYIRVRSAFLSRFLTDLAEQSAVPIRPILMAQNFHAQLAWIEGLDPDPESPFDLIALGYGDPSVIAQDLAWLQSRGWDLGRITMGQTLVAGRTPDYAAAQGRLQTALEAGVKRITFYNYGLLNQPRWAWLKRLAAQVAAKV